MAKARPAPKRDWIKANKPRVKDETGLVGKELDRAMEDRWRNSGLSNHAVAAPVVPGVVAPAVVAPVPAVVVPAAQPVVDEADVGDGQDQLDEQAVPLGEVRATGQQLREDVEVDDGAAGAKRPEKASGTQEVDHGGSNAATPGAEMPGGGTEGGKKRKRSEPDRIRPYPEMGIRDPSDRKSKAGWLKRRTVTKVLKTEALSNVPDQPDNSRWQNGTFLAAGAFGAAYIWFEIDAANNITNRVVVKDCYVEPRQWGQIHHWHGDVRNAEERQHVEIAAMNLIKNRPGSQSIIHLVAFDVDDERRWYRIYMSYCPHGNLQDIIETYRPPEYIPNVVDAKGNPTSVKRTETLDKEKRWRLVKRRRLDPTHENYRPTIGKREEFVPEAYLWSLMESLTEACIVLESGDLEGTDAVPEWDVIVHRDLKPENIYLDSPNAGDRAIFASYPHTRIGDFGLSIITNEADILNPIAYNGDEGTPWWRTPEQCFMIDPATGRPDDVGKLLSPCNVWGLGTLIIALMNRCSACDGTEYQTDKIEPIIDAIAEQVYSDELQRLAKRCVKYWPDERFPLRELRQEIHEHTGIPSGEGSEDLASGMRFGQHAEDDEALRLEYKEDRYKVGFTLRLPSPSESDASSSASEA
ncbi:hypothetical protein LTR36_006185 [Oleoguttula mirabilis]|uniref:non-specific serine/threonine protein kinase n=1 Tax=Oleoguttula mirabilis TaxID=1507867 RepID=A0AAV9JCX5_9PEZI|nr:hypothetical protein LTR36_006185 [Oleoguttula mirabilis]